MTAASPSPASDVDIDTLNAFLRASKSAAASETSTASDLSAPKPQVILVLGNEILYEF
jgi:hypothetical protein